jgi:hypothetical protein
MAEAVLAHPDPVIVRLRALERFDDEVPDATD